MISGKGVLLSFSGLPLVGLGSLAMQSSIAAMARFNRLAVLSGGNMASLRRRRLEFLVWKRLLS
jgi:hypothetical protein